MPPFSARLRRLARAALPAVLLAGSAAGQLGTPVQNPFRSGLRWTHAPAPARPWIPRDLAFVRGGELLWTAPAFGNPALDLLSVSELGGGVVPLHSDPGLSSVVGVLRVAAGDDASELFAVAQEPRGSSRATIVRRHDAVAASRGAPFTARWTYELTGLFDGPARIASTPDGEVLAAAAYDVAAGEVELVLLDPASGAPRVSRRLPGTGLGGLALSADGRRLAVVAGVDLHVVDGSGALLFSVRGYDITSALAISADGACIASGRVGIAGAPGGIELLCEGPGGYATGSRFAVAPSEFVTQVALDDAGETLAFATWNQVTGALALEVRDTRTGDRWNRFDEPVPPGAILQNLPVAVEITPDGRRIALGSWGFGDGGPEVRLFERGRAGPLTAFDVGGSVEALALDESGTRIAVAVKDGHANISGTTGRVVQFDTGERDLQLLGAARLGGRLELALETPRGGNALFVLGDSLAAPIAHRLGALWVDPARPVHFFWGSPASGGRVDLRLPIPPDPALLGRSLAVQAFRFDWMGPALATTTVRPVVL